MQAQATRRLRKEYRSNRVIAITLAMLALLTVSIVGIQMLTDDESTPASQRLSPVGGSIMEDPPLPASWVDPYVNRSVGYPAAADPPLPADWVDPYVKRSTAKTDITPLTLDRDGADVFPAVEANPAPAIPLERTGLDHAAAIDVYRSGTDTSVDSRAPSAEETRFLELNVWEYAPNVQPAGGVANGSGTVPDYQFLEENSWEVAPQTVSSQIGLTEE